MKKIKKIGALAISALLMLTVFTGCAKEDSENSIIFGTSADYAPFEYHTMVDGKDTIVGIDVSLAQQIAKDMDKELVISDKDFSILLNELEGGNLDMVIASLTPDDKRREQADFSDIYYSDVGQKALIRKEDADKYKSIDDFSSKIVAAQTTSIQENAVKDNMPDAVLLSLSSVTDAVNNLTYNKCDAVVVDGAVADGYLSANPELTAIVLDIPASEGCAVAVAKGDPKGLLKGINATIKTAIENNSIAAWAEEISALGK